MTIQPKRQSTTSKVTRKLVQLITAHCANGDWCIVRHNGIEYGVYGIEHGAMGWFLTVEGIRLNPAQCTIRKGLPQLASVAMAA